MSVLANSNAIETGGYNITKSLRFRASGSAYLSRTPSAAGNRRTFTFKTSLKVGSVGTLISLFVAGTNSTTSGFTSAYITAGGVLTIVFYSSTSRVYEVAGLFRDPAKFYEIVIAIDTTQATASDRVRVEVNGKSRTVTKASGFPDDVPLNFDCSWNDAVIQHIGATKNSGGSLSGYFDGYMTEVYNIVGQRLTSSSFGKTDLATNQFVAKPFSGTFGADDTYLPFTDGTSLTTLGYDESGNNNNWTLNNFSLTAGVNYDWMDDTPTNNFAVINRLDPLATGTISKANLTFSTSSGTYVFPSSTIVFPLSGLFYAEFSPEFTTDANNGGLFLIAPSNTVNPGLLPASGSYGLLSFGSAQLISNGSAVVTGLAAVTANEIIQLAVDVTNGKMWVGRNNVWYDSAGGTTGNPSTGTNPTFTGTFSGMKYGIETSVTLANRVFNFNFGQRSFAYAPPTGFKALCTKNLPTPTIKRGDNYFDAVTYVGNGAARDITGFRFSPDFVWFKSRSAATDHAIYDSVRGVTKDLVTNSTAAETTQAQGLTAFNADGFSLGTLAKLNTNAATYVAWAWLEAAGVLDIVSYVGNGANRTIAHNLGAVPKFMIVKPSDAVNDWAVYQAANTVAPETDYLLLNSTAATADDNTYWNDTVPTSSVFSVGTNADVNSNGVNYIAYLFAEVEGFSKFGSYTGNGNADGSFIYCGFKPSFVMIKRTDTGTDNWIMLDSSRSPENVTDDYLVANNNAAEATFGGVDIVSNGFKIRTSSTAVNANGGTYIYMAFAECPFKYSTAW